MLLELKSNLRASSDLTEQQGLTRIKLDQGDFCGQYLPIAGKCYALGFIGFVFFELVVEGLNADTKALCRFVLFAAGFI